MSFTNRKEKDGLLSCHYCSAGINILLSTSTIIILPPHQPSAIAFPVLSLNNIWGIGNELNIFKWKRIAQGIL